MLAKPARTCGLAAPRVHAAHAGVDWELTNFAFETRCMSIMKSFWIQVAQFENKIIREAIEKCAGDRDLAASMLGVSPSTLHRKLVTSDQVSPHGNSGRANLRTLYLISHKESGLTKIGFAASPQLRLSQIRTRYPGVTIIRSMPGTKEDEASLHYTFIEKRKHGEWFTLSEQDIAEIDLWAHKRKHSIPDEVMRCNIVNAPLHFRL